MAASNRALARARGEFVGVLSPGGRLDPAAFAEVGPRRHMLEEMGAAFAAEGMITLAGSRLYMSMADTDAVVDDALGHFDRVFSGVG